MKYCPNCNQTYTDDSLNFCLNDGSTLMHLETDESPPTIMMNSARTTSPNFPERQPTNFPNQPNFGNAPLAGWQNQSMSPNQPQYMAPRMSKVQGQDQTLPIISLVMGVLSILICCYGGLPLGIPALIMGYLGMSNANNDPERYGGKSLAVAGIICGAVGLAIPLVILFLTLVGRLK